MCATAEARPLASSCSGPGERRKGGGTDRNQGTRRTQNRKGSATSWDVPALPDGSDRKKRASQREGEVGRSPVGSCDFPPTRRLDYPAEAPSACWDYPAMCFACVFKGDEVLQLSFSALVSGVLFLLPPALVALAGRAAEQAVAAREGLTSRPAVR